MAALRKTLGSADHPIVKRIIAIGGDRIQIDALGRVYVNGELL